MKPHDIIAIMTSNQTNISEEFMLYEAQISSLLKKSNLIKDDVHFSPISIGMSGAVVLSCNDKYVLKYAHSSFIDDTIMNQFRYEYAFYEQYKGLIYFLPEVVFQTTNEDETLLVLKKYEVIPPEHWTSALQQRAMEIFARINALDCIASFADSWMETESVPGLYPLMESYDNWKKLCDKFPAQINASVLKEMYENFYKLAAYADEFPIPNTFCHGDLASPNFLLDGTRLLVCDWQSTHIGKGIGGVAYFCARGVDLGLTIDREALFDCYSKELNKYASITVAPDMLTRYADLSDWLVIFRHAAEYLQDSDIDQVVGCFSAMVNKYKAILY